MGNVGGIPFLNKNKEEGWTFTSCVLRFVLG